MFTTRELKYGDAVPFIASTHLYGRAEFAFCVVYDENGGIDRVHIIPKQQPKAAEQFVLPMDGRENFSVQSWAGLDHPKIWIHFWCKQHACPAFYCYVPDGSNRFDVSVGGIYFGGE